MENQEVLETEVTEKQEITLIDIEVESVTPAKIKSNINKVKEVMIPYAKKYANVVVTQENFKDIKSLVARLNKQSNALSDYKKKTNKQATIEVAEFEATCKEILEAYKSTTSTLKEQIAIFEEQEKQAKKDKIMITVNQALDYAVTNKYIPEKYKEKFMFDDKWLLTNATQKGIQAGINAELNRLVELHNTFKQQVDSLSQVIKTQCESANIQEFSNDKYVEMLKNDVPLAQIITYVGQDVDNIKKQAEASARAAEEKAKQEAQKQLEEQQKQEKSKQEELLQQAREQAQKDYEDFKNGASQQQTHEHNQVDFTPVADEKTGEVIAKYNDKLIAISEPTIPAKVPDNKIFKYTYEFEGEVKAILYLNRLLKVLTKIFNFNFKKVED